MLGFQWDMRPHVGRIPGAARPHEGRNSEAVMAHEDGAAQPEQTAALRALPRRGQLGAGGLHYGCRSIAFRNVLG